MKDTRPLTKAEIKRLDRNEAKRCRRVMRPILRKHREFIKKLYAMLAKIDRL